MIPPLYDHQQKIINDNKLKCGLFLGTGSAKTRTALELAEGATLVICPKQQREDRTWQLNAEKFGIIINLTVISKEELRRDWQLLPRYDTVIIDECFTKETEVLTDKGFKTFDKLDKTEKIAQWDNFKISFVEPLRYIEKEHDGQMVSFNVKKGINVLMTPNHDQVLVNCRSGEIVKKPISQCSFHQLWRLPTSGFSIEKSELLTPLERMYIATQADGNIHNVLKNYTTIAFTFLKQRKIDRLLKLISEAGLEFSFVKHDKVRHRARIMVKMPTNTTKDIRNHISYPMSSEKAAEIIEEMVEWDGHRIKGGRQYYFSSNDKNQSDFYARVAVLAGHRCYQSIEKDERKETFSDMNRLYISLNHQSEDTQKCKKKYAKYKGKVYCVEVPSGAIVIRHKGFTFITGNCHNNFGVSPEVRQRKGIQIPKTSQIFEATYLYLNKIKPKRLYLCSATPISKPMNMWAIAKLFGQDWDFFAFRAKYYSRIRIGQREVFIPNKSETLKQNLADLVQKFGYTGGLNDFFDVPEQTHKTVKIDLTQQQITAMKEMTLAEADPFVRRSMLRTIENGVLYGKRIENASGKVENMVDDTKIFPSHKIDYILERAIEFPKLLIFANYTAQINEIARVLREEGYPVSTLTGQTKDRGTLITDAEKSKACIIIAQSGISSGYELPSFPCVIYASKSWQFVHYEQSLGRVLRSNALKKNLYIHLVVDGCDGDCHDAIMSGQDFQEKLSLNY